MSLAFGTPTSEVDHSCTLCNVYLMTGLMLCPQRGCVDRQMMAKPSEAFVLQRTVGTQNVVLICTLKLPKQVHIGIGLDNFETKATESPNSQSFMLTMSVRTSDVLKAIAAKNFPPSFLSLSLSLKFKQPQNEKKRTKHK